MFNSGKLRGHAGKSFAGRFSIGLVSALALVLVAFEWSGIPPVRQGYDDGLPLEPPPDLPPVVVIRPPEPAKTRPAIRTRRNPVAALPDVPEPPTDLDPIPDAPAVEGGSVHSGPERSIFSPEPDDGDGPWPWQGVEQRPYFRRCLGLPPDEIDACTERLLEKHLEQHFVVPERMQREERTTVTILIDEHGRIARVLCVPKPSPAVQQEIERVIGGLPELIPASQNGRPVPVVFQLPFRIKRL
jgi:hypothetical protein